MVASSYDALDILEPHQNKQRRKGLTLSISSNSYLAKLRNY